MSEIHFINKTGQIHKFNLANGALPADGSWDWAKKSCENLAQEWRVCDSVCPSLAKQFTDNNGALLVTEGDLADVYRHYLKIPEAQIDVDDLKRTVAFSSDEHAIYSIHNGEVIGEGPRHKMLAFTNDRYARIEPETLIAGSPYKEAANVVAHELTHAGDRNAAGLAKWHSDSPLFDMVMEIDRTQRGEHSAVAHMEAAYRRGGQIPGASAKAETLARMVENVVHNPQGEFHPLVKSYVNNVFLKDMEFKAAGLVDKRMQLRLATNFSDGHDLSMLALHQDIKSAVHTVDAEHATAKTLSFIDTIPSVLGVTQPAVESNIVRDIEQGAEAVKSGGNKVPAAGSWVARIWKHPGGKAGIIGGGLVFAGAGIWALRASQEDKSKQQDTAVGK